MLVKGVNEFYREIVTGTLRGHIFLDVKTKLREGKRLAQGLTTGNHQH